MTSRKLKSETHPFLLLVNGKLVREEFIDPAWSLVYFLREHMSLTGVKVGCGQGGCGACTVLITRYYPDEEKFRHYSANACITPIASVHGCHVMTIENLSDKKKNTCHVIQDAIVKGNGSQCGFCTPGMVMSMLAASYAEKDQSLDIAKVKKAIQGNLCRCTGYRPILDAFKDVSFGRPSKCGGGANKDIEDLTAPIQSLEPIRTVLSNDRTELTKIEILIKTIFHDKPHSFQNVEFVGPKVHWMRPNTLVQLSTFVRKNPEAKIVSGCTSTEFHPQKPYLEREAFIQCDWLKDLHSFEIYDTHICVGGGVTVAQFTEHLQESMESLPAQKDFLACILSILRRFGSPQIRNTATIGGCLSVNNSASDLQTLANAFEFTALCFNPVSQAHSEIKAFPTIGTKNSLLVINVKIPFTMTNEYTWAYKLSRRRFFDTAILNIASKTQVIPPLGNEDAKIFKINLSFGGSAIKRFSLLFAYGSNPENLTRELFIKMNNDIQRDITSHLNTHMYSKVYISTLAKNLFKKFYEFLHDALHPSVTSSYTDPDELALDNLKATQALAIGKLNQKVTDLVWRPIPHASAYKHATGTAIYCDDVPKYKGELAMVLIYSKRAHAFLKKVDFSKGLELDGLVGFISHEDIPKDKNLFGVIVNDEEIFASDKVKCVGQLIGAVLATDSLIAKKAAALIDTSIEYIDCHPRILTISDAIGYQSFFEEHSTSLKVGNADAALQESEHVLADEVKLGAQIHFYMEPQSAIAIPHEDDEMELIIACQNPAEVQLAVAQTLGIVASKVVVRVKRVGGGFGGKDTRTVILMALPIAIAAQKFGRPVRCILDRQTDMTIMGKREPFLAKYEVGFNSDGRVKAIKMNIYCNAGISLDSSGVPIERAVLNLDSAYNILNLDIYGVPCKSNKPSNTVFRGPGTVQGSHFIENIMDRVAAHLNKDPAEVRILNMYEEGNSTPYGQILDNSTVRQCWKECLESSNYYERKAEEQLFNSTHLYRKRGIYMTPCHFGIGYIFLTLNQAGALVHIYRDGSVLLNHGGVEIGQGLHTKMIQVATRELGIPANKIRILETSTDKVPNAAPTSASMSSDLNGMAIANACIILKERLAPYFKMVPKLSWEEIISKAYSDRVSLSSVGFHKTPGLSWNPNTKRGSPFSYFVSGAACSEVEVDCLTGEYQILRTDLVMDVGKSLNPAIDIGQIEGAFVQGVGLFTLEEMVSDDFGNLLTTGTSTYKIPTASDIPLEFNVSFLQGSSNPKSIFSSKTVGEPPLILANSVYFAIKDAVRQFRKQLGLDTKFKMDSPATVEKVLDACNDLYEPLAV